MRTLLLSLLLLSLLTLNGCSKSGSPQGSSSGSLLDDQWHRCTIDLANLTNMQCANGSLEAMGLTKAEIDYVRNTLDHAPWLPMKADVEATTRYFGVPPSVSVAGKAIYSADTHGLCSGCEVHVYFYQGHISQMHWYVPNRFLLTKYEPRNVQ